MATISSSLRICPIQKLLLLIPYSPRSILKYLLCLTILISVNQLSPQTGSSQKIKSEIKELRGLPDFEPNDVKHIDLLLELGNSLVYINTDTLLVLSAEIKDLSAASNYFEGLVGSEIISSYFYNLSGDNTKAIIHCDKAISLGLEKQLYHLVANAYRLKGNTWFKLNKYAETFMSYQNALVYAKEVEDYESVAANYMNMATVFSLLNDHEEALTIYEKALEVEPKSPNVVLRSMILSNIAFLRVNMGDYEDALKNVNIGIQNFKTESKPAWLAFCYNIKGNIFVKRKNYQKAIENFNKSKSIHDSIQDVKGLADVRLGYANAYFGLKQYELAEEEALKSSVLYQQVNLKSGILDTYGILSKIKEQKRSPEEALFYLKKAQTLSDSILKNDKSSKIALIRAQTLFEEKQNQTAKENLAEIKTQKKYTYLILSVLLGSLLFLFFIYKANSKVRKINQELAKQSRALEESKKSLQEMNAMKDKLFSIIGHDFKAPIINLKQLLIMATQEDISPNELKKALLRLTSHTDSVHFTLDNLLAWGKTQMKGFKTESDFVNIEVLAQNNISLFKEQISNKNLSVNLDLGGENTVWADKNHVDLIIRNLLYNAIKFSYAHGLISLTAKSNDDKVIIAIQDHGVGFPPELLKGLFIKNQHTSTYGTLNEKGTGLGLLFCKEAVNVNLGELWMVSEPDVKTTVFFSLPRVGNYADSSENVVLGKPKYA